MNVDETKFAKLRTMGTGQLFILMRDGELMAWLHGNEWWRHYWGWEIDKMKLDVAKREAPYLKEIARVLDARIPVKL